MILNLKCYKNLLVYVYMIYIFYYLSRLSVAFYAPDHRSSSGSSRVVFNNYITSQNIVYPIYHYTYILANTQSFPVTKRDWSGNIFPHILPISAPWINWLLYYCNKLSDVYQRYGYYEIFYQ